jgi:hypothetical protein
LSVDTSSIQMGQLSRPEVKVTPSMASWLEDILDFSRGGRV